MKTKHNLFVIILVVFGCSTSYDSGSSPDLPEGSEVEEYADIPGLVKVTVRTPDGAIAGEGDYYNGVRHGTWTEYDSDKRFVKSISTYNSGKKQGVEFTFDRGYVVSKTYYSNDLEHGVSVSYNRRGVTEEKNYYRGMLHGMVRKYYNDGVLMEESLYRNGVPDGLSRWYDQEGNLKFEYLYDKGKLVENNPATAADSSGSDQD